MALSVVPTFTCDRCGKTLDEPVTPVDETVTLVPPVGWTNLGGKRRDEASPPSTATGYLCETCSVEFSSFMTSAGAGGMFKPSE